MRAAATQQQRHYPRLPKRGARPAHHPRLPLSLWTASHGGGQIDWNLVDPDGDLERKRRWFGADEFIYELDKAPKGHLPLTSALRGTQLIKALFKHPAWEREEFADSGKGKYDK